MRKTLRYIPQVAVISIIFRPMLIFENVCDKIYTTIVIWHKLLKKGERNV